MRRVLVRGKRLTRLARRVIVVCRGPLYKLINGVASSSFGAHVAHLAGVPHVVRRAEVDFAKKFK